MPHRICNGIQLYYEMHGPADAFPVVFVNGLLSDTTSWGFQVPAFAQHFRVLTYDCRGQGQSDKPLGPYSQALHAQDLLGLMDALDVCQAHIVGLSNGGTIAMQFALEHSERVARLVLVDTFGGVDALMAAKLKSWLLALDAGGPLLRFDVGTPWVWSQSFMQKHPEILALLRDKVIQANGTAVRALIMGTMEYDIRARLHGIRAPTLVLVGEEDLLTPPWYARELATRIPGAQLVIIPQTGHALTIENPTVFNALALAFLQSAS